METNENLMYQINYLIGDLHVLKIKLQNFKWNSKCDDFFIINPMIDGIIKKINQEIDSLVERVFEKNERPYAALNVYLKHTIINEVESKPYSGKEIILYLTKDFKLLLSEVNIFIKIAQDIDDNETAVILSKIASLYEKYIWMLGGLS